MKRRSSWNKIALAAAVVIVPALSCGQRSLVLLDVKASSLFTDPSVLLSVQLTLTANRDLTTRYPQIRLGTDMPYQIGMYLPADMTGTVTFDATIDNHVCKLGTGTAVATGVQSGDTTQPIQLVINPVPGGCIPIGDGGPGGGGGTTGAGGTTGSSGAGGTTGTGGVTGTAGVSGSAGVSGAAGAAGASGTAGAGGVSGAAGRGGTTGAGGVTGSAGAGARGGTTGTAGTGGVSGVGGVSGMSGRGGVSGTAGVGGSVGAGGAGGLAGRGGTTGSAGIGGAGPGAGGLGGLGGVGGVGGAGPGVGGAGPGVGGAGGVGPGPGTGGAGPGVGGAGGSGTSCGVGCLPPFICDVNGQCVCSESPLQACSRALIQCGYVIDNCNQQVFCPCKIAGQVCDTTNDVCFSNCTTGTGGIVTADIICPTQQPPAN